MKEMSLCSWCGLSFAWLSDCDTYLPSCSEGLTSLLEIFMLSFISFWNFMFIDTLWTEENGDRLMEVCQSILHKYIYIYYIYIWVCLYCILTLQIFIFYHCMLLNTIGLKGLLSSCAEECTSFQKCLWISFIHLVWGILSCI